MPGKDTGGPAFPVPFSLDPDVGGPVFADCYGNGGMTLRDYFAAKAMLAMCDHTTSRWQIARDAYELADAMLKERAK